MMMMIFHSRGLRGVRGLFPSIPQDAPQEWWWDSGGGRWETGGGGTGGDGDD